MGNYIFLCLSFILHFHFLLQRYRLFSYLYKYDAYIVRRFLFPNILLLLVLRLFSFASYFSHANTQTFMWQPKKENNKNLNV